MTQGNSARLTFLGDDKDHRGNVTDEVFARTVYIGIGTLSPETFAQLAEAIKAFYRMDEDALDTIEVGTRLISYSLAAGLMSVQEVTDEVLSVTQGLDIDLEIVLAVTDAQKLPVWVRDPNKP